MALRLARSIACSALLTGATVSAINVVPTDYANLKQASFVVSHGMAQYYSGNQSGQSPGYLPGEGQADGYYWWEGAGFFGSLIDYWYYTGDSTYNDISMQALTWQMGANFDYEPQNASQTLGNDDIGFWAMSALKAAELTFPNPPEKRAQWIPVVQTVFNNFVGRWDAQTCGGGLRWQVFALAAGYRYKNAISNGAFFNIAARLGKYSGNQTYFDWADKIYDWVWAVNLIDHKSFVVWDGCSPDQNCTQVNASPWTYNTGIFLHGAANMWNATGDEKWKQRTLSLLKGLQGTFVLNNIITEIGCQETNTCNNDEKSFKAYVLNWLSEVAKVASFTEPQVTPILKASGIAAGQSCTGGADQVTCGVNWNIGHWDGSKGIGEEMCALEAFNSLMGPWKPGPIKNFKDGGKSAINPNAGSSLNGGNDVSGTNLPPITGGDKAGAGIVTALLVLSTLLATIWMIFDDPLKWFAGPGRS